MIKLEKYNYQTIDGYRAQQDALYVVPIHACTELPLTFLNQCFVQLLIARKEPVRYLNLWRQIAFLIIAVLGFNFIFHECFGKDGVRDFCFHLLQMHNDRQDILDKQAWNWTSIRQNSAYLRVEKSEQQRDSRQNYILQQTPFIRKSFATPYQIL